MATIFAYGFNPQFVPAVHRIELSTGDAPQAGLFVIEDNYKALLQFAKDHLPITHQKQIMFAIPGGE